MRSLPILFSIALFGAALLSFSVQPMLGKMLLPMVGGAPAGWIVALAFFQISLLAGYGLSYGLSRFSPWGHLAGLLALYAAGFAFLPPHLPLLSDEIGGMHLSIAVVKALGQTILLPYLALTATTAALQRVFAATRHETAKDPYYLFVASNLGSFIGLFAYPFVLEPFFGLHFQAHLWQGVYIAVIGFIVLACAVAWRHRVPVDVERVQAKTRLPLRRLITWMALAFIPCSLSMGVTTLITTDIGGLPLFWVVPLGLYLLTFILAFAKKPVIALPKLQNYQIIICMVLVYIMGTGTKYQPGGPFWLVIGMGSLLLIMFFMIALMCHQSLAEDRPETEHLALFYFILALGGGLAGLLHAFVVPFVLPNLIEFPIMALLSLWLYPLGKKLTPRLNGILWAMLVLAVLGLIVVGYTNMHHLRGFWRNLGCFVFLFSVPLLAVRPRLLMVVGLVAVIVSTVSHYPGTLQMSTRNFFGLQAVYDDKRDGVENVRHFVHGNTLHGFEILGHKGYSYGYYVDGNPIQDVMTLSKAKEIAILGLGTGQLGCYQKKAIVDFYEIDPDVEMVAKKYFSYLRDCPPRDVFIGDGRLMIERENRHYDVIVQDAFNSDGIPTHLITKEAFAMYRQRLTTNGIMLFHISNRYLDLEPVLAAVAETQGLSAYTRHFVPKEKGKLALESKWLAVPLNKEDGEKLLALKWRLSKPADKPWTDDWSTLLTSINMNGF